MKIAQLEITHKRKIDSAECVLLVLSQFQAVEIVVCASWDPFKPQTV